MPAARFRFDDFVLDADRRELTRAGVPVSMTSQALELLLHLVRHRDRLLSKDDLVAGAWGGRIVSDSTLTSHVNFVRTALGDDGKAQRYVRTIPRRGVRFVAEVEEMAPETSAASAPAPTAAMPLPDKPSIAVLAFANMSDDPAQEYFADGIAEDITTALSKWRQFFVIARNSAFTYKGRNVAIPQVGRELGVRYVLEGSVRKAGGRLRITAQLIEAASDRHVWSERYDGALDDVFDLQDRIAGTIVSTLETRLRVVELERIRHKRPENFEAYDWFLQGLTHFYAATKPRNDEALRLLSMAMTRDPDYAPAYAVAAYCHYQRRQGGWGPSVETNEAEGLHLAEAALARAIDDAQVLWMAGRVITSMVPDVARGLALVERSLALNANCAQAWSAKGWAHGYAMEGEESRAAFERAIRLSPLDPMAAQFYAGIAASHMVTQTYEQGVEWGRRAVQIAPRSTSARRIFCAVLALAGRDEEAREAMRGLLMIEPTLTIAGVERSRTNQLDARLQQRMMSGLRRAGMPEG